MKIVSISMPPKAAVARRGRLRPYHALFPAGVLLSILAFLLYIGAIGGNFRTVTAGQAYRSGQLWPDHLQRVIREHKIRSVISLKGGDLSKSWYRQENEICEKNGAKLYRVQLTASQLPRPAQLSQLLELFDTVEYPLLFHCTGGADRSGLAATLYLHTREKLPLDEAQQRGLTWRYGHFQAKAPNMDRFFDIYRREGAGQDLRGWIRTGYPEAFREHRSSVARVPAGALLIPLR